MMSLWNLGWWILIPAIVCEPTIRDLDHPRFHIRSHAETRLQKLDWLVWRYLELRLQFSRCTPETTRRLRRVIRRYQHYDPDTMPTLVLWCTRTRPTLVWVARWEDPAPGTDTGYIRYRCVGIADHPSWWIRRYIGPDAPRLHNLPFTAIPIEEARTATRSFCVDLERFTCVSRPCLKLVVVAWRWWEDKKLSYPAWWDHVIYDPGS